MAFQCKRCQRELARYEQREGFCDECLRNNAGVPGKYKPREFEMLDRDSNPRDLELLRSFPKVEEGE